MDAYDTLIDICGVRFRRSVDRYILNGINIKVQRGKITAIMGPSGCGKTTTLRLMTGQLQPESGNVYFSGHDLSGVTRGEMLQLRRRMGMLFQSGALFTDLSVYENVAFPLRVHTDLPETMIRDLVLIKLEAVGLRGARDLMPSELSGGMARRAALARTIVLDPEVVLYDEPFAGQDPIFVGVLQDLIHRINRALGSTSVIVSHDVSETVAIADYVYLMADGRIIGEGLPDEVVHSDDPEVRQFLQGLSDGPVPFHYPAPEWQSDLRLEPR
jgi:phospholipid/cholesterol/gamma-HCH transport system ATP-binding protein